MEKKLTIHSLPGYDVKQVQVKHEESLRIEVRKPGASKPYIVVYNPNSYGESIIPGWACSCLGWINKRGDVRKCKHLTGLEETLLQVGDARRAA